MIAQHFYECHPALVQVISVIIPVLNEALDIGKTLASVHKANVEVIVVDGGSRDDTKAVAESWGVKVLSAPTGRGRQMNAGARVASGKIFLFLHADTLLPENFAPMVIQALNQPNTVAGAFALQIEGELPSLRWVEKGVNWRSRTFSFPYGDQAIFMSAEVFYQLGGFPDLPIMEDFEMMRRLRRIGKILLLTATVVTSGRRWVAKGVFKTTLINQLTIVAYLLGVSPERLSRWYRHI